MFYTSHNELIFKIEDTSLVSILINNITKCYIEYTINGITFCRIITKVSSFYKDGQLYLSIESDEYLYKNYKKHKIIKNYDTYINTYWGCIPLNVTFYLGE